MYTYLTTTAGYVSSLDLLCGSFSHFLYEVTSEALSSGLQVARDVRAIRPLDARPFLRAVRETKGRSSNREARVNERRAPPRARRLRWVEGQLWERTETSEEAGAKGRKQEAGDSGHPYGVELRYVSPCTVLLSRILHSDIHTATLQYSNSDNANKLFFSFLLFRCQAPSESPRARRGVGGLLRILAFC